MDTVPSMHNDSHTIDWSTAWTERIMPRHTEAFRLRTVDMSHRLRTELASGRLPCINMPYAEELTHDLSELTPYLQRFKHMVVLGIGGSSLGARALQKAFFPQQDWPNHTGAWLWVADNVDAQSIEALLHNLNPRETIVVTISKSGGTIETIAQYFFFRTWLQEALGASWQEHMLLITDAQHGFLRQEALEHGTRSLSVPDNLGGRYSVLSAVGLVPAAFLGIDWQGLLQGACAVGRSLAAHSQLEGHPAWRLALWNAALMEQGYSQLIFFSYIPQWATFSAWFNQLWAESLGKEGKGSMPIPAVGVTDQHSIQQMFLDGPRDKACLCITSAAQKEGMRFACNIPEQWQFLAGQPLGNLLQSEALGTRMALHNCHVPLVTLDMASTAPESAGRMISLLEITTLLTGWLLNVNPLDQPAVELGKRLANAHLGASGYSNEKAQLTAFMQRPRDQQEF